MSLILKHEVQTQRPEGLQSDVRETDDLLSALCRLTLKRRASILGLRFFKSQRPRFVQQLSSVDLEHHCGIPLDWMATRPAPLMSQLVKMRSSVPPARRRRDSSAKTSINAVIDDVLPC
ncbi:hypothetical protein Mpe_B0609 (plasmid) [Methylibium petroleiphilum PM1]|uniref:Uncharacterized protein n=1 Tax=Methylibium petroleiphilum (strain ATCC BAA-1232 / LMG 22953 / PM1) TaxID=420662 RepID=A2SP84_METPP|nr:hypothetical protein Mpe_B0609 [Methylibium petroleiphilum PM1]